MSEAEAVPLVREALRLVLLMEQGAGVYFDALATGVRHRVRAIANTLGSPTDVVLGHVCQYAFKCSPATCIATYTGTKIARLMTVFLAGAELFRDGTIHRLLDVLLALYTRAGPVDFGNVPGVAFVDLYTAFVYHVSARMSLP